MSGYYPIMLKIEGERCVVVGGGEVAERKVGVFLDCGASVSVISPDLSPKLQELGEKGQIEVVKRQYEPGDLRKAVLAVAATDDSTVNEGVFEEGQQLGIPVNVVDVPDKCSFIVPSILRRGDLVVAVSTSGRSPALARKIRSELEKTFEAEYESLALLVSEVRADLLARGVQVKSDVWQQALEVDRLLDLLRRDQWDEAKRSLTARLEGKAN